MNLALAGLCKIELPSATLLLAEGGLIVWSADTFVARDPVWGTIGAVQSLAEGDADELPPLGLTLLPPSQSAAADLCNPAVQGSRVRLWLAVWDPATGAVTGTPQLRFDGEIDEATLSIDNSIDLTVIAKAARLFELNIGNALSPAWHKSVWPGETGHDNATGLGRAVAWGVDSPGAYYSAAAVGGMNAWALRQQGETVV